MSIAVAVKFPDRVEIVTDTALTDPDTLVFRDERCKLRPLASQVALLVRGYTDVADRLEESLRNHFAQFATVDEAISTLRANLEESNNRPATNERTMFEANIFAVSETNGPQILWFQNGSSIPDRSIWTLYDAEGLYGAEFLPTWMADALRATGSLQATAVYLMNRSRSRSQDEAGNHAQGIGGAIDHTIIDISGVRTTHIYRWVCDVEGQLLTPWPPIDAEHMRGKLAFEAVSPVSLDPPASPQPVLNRRARKAAQAQLRRAA